MKAILTVLAVILVILAGCAQQAPPSDNTTACTMEAKICPDGTAVGRTGQNCEFAPCPEVKGNESNVTPPPLVGNDTDEHGCKPSAGYSWCEILKKCVREFETPCVVSYTVKTANSSLGEILVDDRGYSLYLFTADSVNKSTCYGTCAANWPPLLVTDTIAIPSGLPGEMGAILRTDNTTQVTYNGVPLYYYAADTEPGDVKGEGVGGKWFVVKPHE
ncbi:MAG: hypothetical protein AB1529_03380 [Candidatus Micrarchaeota archaeon]